MRASKALLFSGAMLCGLAAVGTLPAHSAELNGPAMLAALPAGGYLIYFRHAMSNTAQNDADPIKVGDCSTQRNLSDEGKAQARSIGAAFQAMGISVDKVYTSAFCRAKDTGVLAFGAGKQKESPALFYSLALPKDEAVKAAAELKKMLGTAPGQGSNTVMVGHTSNLKEVAGVWPKKEGGAFVFKPDGNGGFALAGSFEPADLATSQQMSTKK